MPPALRIALTVADFAAHVAFYRDGLGLTAAELWTENGNGQLLLGGAATLEVFDARQAAYVDQLEVGQRVSGAVRLAIAVDDLDAALAQALQHGGTLVHAAVLTPWGDRNARITSPDGLHITLYQPRTEA